MLYNPRLILYTPDALNDYGKSLAEQYPSAELMEIKQHNRLPETATGHYKAKSDILVLGKSKKSSVTSAGEAQTISRQALPTGVLAAVHIVTLTGIKLSIR